MPQRRCPQLLSTLLSVTGGCDAKHSACSCDGAVAEAEKSEHQGHRTEQITFGSVSRQLKLDALGRGGACQCHNERDCRLEVAQDGIEKIVDAESDVFARGSCVMKWSSTMS